MNVNDIISKLEKAGFKQPKLEGTICSLNVAGCFISGEYKGIANIKSKGNPEGYDCHKFVVAKDGEGEALVGKEATKPTALKAGEYLVFSTGLTRILLDEKRVGKTVSLICDKVEPYETKDAKGKKLVIDSPHHIIMDGATA